MRKLIVSEFMTLDGVIQAPGGKDEDRDGGFEPMPAGDPFGDMMNTPKKRVVSRTLEKPVWRNTTIIRDNVVDEVRAIKAQPGKNILLDGSSQLVHTLLEHDFVDELHLLVYPLFLGSGKRLFPNGVRQEFKLHASTPYPTGVVGLHYIRRS